MARTNADAWVPEENDSQVITRVNQNSAVEAVARRIAMGSDTIKVPRMGRFGVDIVPKGATYTDAEPVLDNVILDTRKFGKTFTLAEEDLQDTVADVVSGYQLEWAVSYARELDNAAIACTGVENGTTVPFTSLYASASAGQKIASAGAVTYTHLSEVMAKYEGSDYANDADTVVMAHPSFKATFRGILDSNNRPIFVEGVAGTPSTLFGIPVNFSYGLKTSATMTDAPTGNALLVVGNRQHLLLGVRGGPESLIGEEFRSDEKILKVRARRGFAVARPEAFGILEVTTA
ncbi:phage major capsid protein [Streptomyces sp. E2N171]|uniref:phage major capsid protein n=1 Tax=Streptomyces sp. E2N171 TaxID=1851914 RepID=UPI000EF5D381|nr:phage major capsid protein [Streptomyces sp. E2N171]